MFNFLRRAMGCVRTAGLFILPVSILCGCATARLNSARHNFHVGRFVEAGKILSTTRVPEKDRVLFLMERGMIRQMQGAHSESSRDFIRAADLLEDLRTYSISKGTASVVVNDGVQSFRGFPFERTLLHAFTAKNHLAEGHWDNAAVEARRIIHSLTPEMKGDYPEDAYSRYMAGFCLEMIDDFSNASLQYRKAGALLKHIDINGVTGRLHHGAGKTVSVGSSNRPQTELICFTLSGRTPSGPDIVDRSRPLSPAVYGEIFCRGQYLGRGYTLADTADLAFTSDQADAVRKAVKTVARVAIKEEIADAVEKNDEFLGSLTRFVLIGLLERPDLRRWETLPRWLGVARVACPSDLKDFDVVFKTSSGAALRRIHVDKPITRRRNIFVSFCRDIVPYESVRTIR